ncbi:Uncharacterised protein [Candidatus Gugararchaeum adminiculabundum]|nr:Uncharacterised protein [Candidatus Gugararchaeum adminiculabundum]
METQAEPRDEELQAHILYTLARRGKWGASHTSLIYVRAGLPPSRRRKAEKLAKGLANKGLLTWLMKTGEIHISLNPRARKEITQLVEAYLGKVFW